MSRANKFNAHFRHVKKLDTSKIIESISDFIFLATTLQRDISIFLFFRSDHMPRFFEYPQARLGLYTAHTGQLPQLIPRMAIKGLS